MKHVPVLLKEVLEVMVPVDGGRYFDGTLGDGGHAMAILDACSPSGELAGCDLDRDALTGVSQALKPFHPRAHLFHANYASIDDICDRLGWVSLDGVLVAVVVGGVIGVEEMGSGVKRRQRLRDPRQSVAVEVAPGEFARG